MHKPYYHMNTKPTGPKLDKAWLDSRHKLAELNRPPARMKTHWWAVSFVASLLVLMAVIFLVGLLLLVLALKIWGGA